MQLMVVCVRLNCLCPMQWSIKIAVSSPSVAGIDGLQDIVRQTQFVCVFDAFIPPATESHFAHCEAMKRK